MPELHNAASPESKSSSLFIRLSESSFSVFHNPQIFYRASVSIGSLVVQNNLIILIIHLFNLSGDIYALIQRIRFVFRLSMFSIASDIGRRSSSDKGLQNCWGFHWLLGLKSFDNFRRTKLDQKLRNSYYSSWVSSPNRRRFTQAAYSPWVSITLLRRRQYDFQFCLWAGNTVVHILIQKNIFSNPSGCL